MRWLGAGLLAALLIVPTAVGQAAPDPVEPEVEFPDVEIEDPVVPLDAPATATLEATIACSMLEPPTGEMLVTTEASAPGYANTIVSPASASFPADPAACAQGTPHVFEPQVSIALTQSAPAFERFNATVSIVVEHAPPTGDAFGPYGPYTANVSVMPGFLVHYNARSTEKVPEVPTGGTATFGIVLDNFSNGPTEFTFEPANVSEGVEVTAPEPVVLEPNATSDVTVQARDRTDVNDEGVHTFEIAVEGASTDPRGEMTMSKRLAFLVEVDPGSSEGLASASEGTDQAAVPWPGLAGVAWVLVGAAVLARRARS